VLLCRSTVSTGDAAADTGSSQSTVDNEQVETTAATDISSTPSAASDTTATAAPSQDFDIDHESGLIREPNQPMKQFPAKTISGRPYYYYTPVQTRVLPEIFLAALG